MHGVARKSRVHPVIYSTEGTEALAAGDILKG